MAFRRLSLVLAGGVLALACAVAAQDKPDILIADFEGPTYGDWKTTGEAFGPRPARGTLPQQMDVTGFKGHGLVNSYFHGDGTTGTLTSPEFAIERRYLNFLIGGGAHPGETCINLLVNGQAVRTATGPNAQPGGSERLHWASWDVGDLMGKKAVIQIVDQHTGGWGHINIDQIVQSDEQATKEVSMKLIAEKRYLNLPVKNGAEKIRMRVLLKGAIVREFDIELAEGEPDFWVFMDLASFIGQELEFKVEGGQFQGQTPKFVQSHPAPKPASQGISESVPEIALCQDDAIKGAENLYQEKLRPQFHFSSRRGWNNDPNGLVYHQGEYHLYYQHNPYGWKWDNMHWGHAVSPDLVHWTELPIALYPKQYGDWCFSGSAVVDTNNTAGFKTGAEDVLVAAFTSTGRGEAIAYSNDRGRTFTDYAGNPVVAHVGRDPKVIWHEPTQRWVMAVYDEKGDSKGIAFYTSPDLKTWEFQSRTEEYFECPELFELAVDGSATKKWVVYSGDGNYAIGTFDGRAFTKESGKHRFSYGNCFYASQTFNNIPPEDGRRVQIGWGTVAIPGMPFNQMMTFPCELTLRTTTDGLRMFANPVKEIETLYAKEHVWEKAAIKPGENLLAGLTGDLFHVRAEFEIGKASELGFVIRGTPVTYDVVKEQLACADKTAPLKPVEGRICLELLIDRVSIEIFGNDGLVYMPMGVIFPDDNRAVEVFSKNGETIANRLAVYELRSAWQRAE